MSRMFCIARYVFILGCRSVRERAKRAEPLLSLSSLRITNPPTSRMPRIVESREQLTRPRPCGNGRPPMGVRPVPVVSIYLFRNLCQKLRDLSTIEHKLEQPFICQNMLKHIVKHLRWNRTNMCSCLKRFTNCRRISNTCS